MITKDVEHYAKYSTLINSHYVNLLGYNLQILTDDHLPEDRRWNKIKSLSNILNDLYRLKRHDFQYLIYFDADFVFLDGSWDVVEEVVNKYASYDVIMGKDSLDYANSGFMIIKTSAWSQFFFQEWWDQRYAKNTFCDQHVLNKLSLLYREEIQSHLLVLPKHTVNSFWPAIEHFNASMDRVLHLMGEFPEIREKIFTALAQRHCVSMTTHNTIVASASSPAVLPSPFLATSNDLRQWKNEGILEKYRSLAGKCKKKRGNSEDKERNNLACIDLLAVIEHSCAMEHRYRSFHQWEEEDRGGMGCPAFVLDMPGVLAMALHEGNVDAWEVLEGQLTVRVVEIVYTNDWLPWQEHAEEVRFFLSEINALSASHNANAVVYYTLRRRVLVSLIEHLHRVAQWQLAVEWEEMLLQDFAPLLRTLPRFSPPYQQVFVEYLQGGQRLVEALVHVGREREAIGWCQEMLPLTHELHKQFYEGEERLLVLPYRRLLRHCLAIPSFLTAQDPVVHWLDEIVTLQYHALDM